MDTISTNEMNILLRIFKDYNTKYNANSISKIIDITSMGALKISKSLESKNIIEFQKMANAKFYNINYKNSFSKEYISFLLSKELNESNNRIKRWVHELKELEKFVNIGLIFGSLLETEKYNDVDVVLVFDKKNSKHIDLIIKKINSLTLKKLHVIKQTSRNFSDNLRKNDPILTEALKKGIIFTGNKKLVNIIENVTCKK